MLHPVFVSDIQKEKPLKPPILQGDPNQNLPIQMVITLKISISIPVLVMPNVFVRCFQRIVNKLPCKM